MRETGGCVSPGWACQDAAAEASVCVPVFCAPYAATKDDQYRTQPAAPAAAAEIRAALASARR
jgi:hypothetical protein